MFFSSLLASAAILSQLAVATANGGSCPAYDNVNVFIASGGVGFGFGSINPAGKDIHRYAFPP